MTASDFTLSTAHEWMAHDPFGRPKPSDVSAETPASGQPGHGVLRAPRNGYVSFRLLVRGAGEYRLRARMSRGIEVDLFKAWYHRLPASDHAPETFLPDALIPVRGRSVFQLPDPDNRIEGQTTQEFWVDLFVPAAVKPGESKGAIELSVGRSSIQLPIRLEVLEQVVPDEPCVQMDHNSYGCRWAAAEYPQLFGKAGSGDRLWSKAIDVLHNRYRIFHEHRALYHNLGYGHSGSTDPIYKPGLVGAGSEKRIEGWELFDRHYGPLLDGSVFSKASPGAPPPRRPADPVWGVYTPINPEWPASYLYWGQPGYEVEFTRGVRQFDAHLREKGWTRTRMEFFFNHKKRYRWFEWDGDETKYAKDNDYILEMGRMWKEAVAGSPVAWVYRLDSSWQMKNQFERLAGCVNFWIAGGFVYWYRQELQPVLARGDIVWTYGGLPAITAASSAVLANVFKTWSAGLTGFVCWNTATSADPWFRSDGETLAAIYPGERFGIPGPIPSVRLKIQRNAVQDVDLITRASSPEQIEVIRAGLLSKIPITVWKKPPRAAREMPPEDWDSQNLSEEHEPGAVDTRALDPLWWRTLRELALGVGEARI